MNSFQLKILAVTLMVIDHIGAIFFPQTLILRVIGRLSFPIFAFLISEGVKHTRNIYKYMLSMAVLAIISEPVFWLAFRSPYKNIFFTLLASILVIFVYQKIKFKPLSFTIILVILLISELFLFDYSFFGVLLPFVFWKIDFSKKMGIVILTGLLSLTFLSYTAFINRSFGIQIFSLLALPLIFLYNGQRGPKLKYLFYFFYPVHLGILAAIKFLT